MRILIATDQTDVLRSILDGIPGVEVVQEASISQSPHLTKRLQPDLLVIDLSTIVRAKWDAVLTSVTADPKLRVVSVSPDSSEDSLLSALRLGVAAYVSKDAASTELPEAIDTLRKGGLYLSDAIVKFIARKRLSHLLGQFAVQKAKPEDSSSSP